MKEKLVICFSNRRKTLLGDSNFLVFNGKKKLLTDNRWVFLHLW